jgi:hypothetical protein
MDKLAVLNLTTDSFTEPLIKGMCIEGKERDATERYNLL